MRGNMYNKIIAVFIFSAFLVGFKQNKTTSDNPKGDFAIYLLKSDTLKTWEARQLPLSSLTLADKPLISFKDIIRYDSLQHNITLTAGGIIKVKSFFSKRTSKVPIPFIVAVGSEKIYLGNVFVIGAPYIVPDVPYIHSSFKKTLTIFRSADGNTLDKRMDERIYKALRKRNKLN